MEPGRAKNHFGNKDAAALYARGRVDYHPHVVERLRRITGPMDLAVDVGCGTGLSTRALRAVAQRVIGVDPSPAMIAQAERPEGVTYTLGRAERLPLADDAADLIAVSQAIHWVEDRPAFFREVHRVLRPGGFLTVWTFGFRGPVEGEGWDEEAHRERYPSPPRASRFSEADLEPGGFRLIAEEPYELQISLDREALAAYFLSQSSALAAVEEGRETFDEARGWFLERLEPLFPVVAARPFVFGGTLWVVSP